MPRPRDQIPPPVIADIDAQGKQGLLQPKPFDTATIGKHDTIDVSPAALKKIVELVESPREPHPTLKDGIGSMTNATQGVRVGPEVAKEYAAEAARLIGPNMMGPSLANVRRLLRLALAHLE
jgi:hypothetical protein